MSSWLALSEQTAAPVFWLIVGVSLGVTALGACAWWIVRSTRRARVSLHRDERGTAVFEFPFALLLLVIVVMLTWQLGLLANGYLVVDFAAFVAARSAAVVVGEDHGHAERRGRLARDDFRSSKGRVVREAAALALVPIAGEAPRGTLGSRLGREAYQALAELDPPGAPKQSYTSESVRKRVVYALEATRLKAKSGRSYKGGRHITVEVEHDFELVIPFARRILGTRKGETYVSPIRATATIVSEGFGPEQMPAGVPRELLP